MKNMKHKINDGMKRAVKKIALNAGDKTIGGTNCRIVLHEPEIPKNLLKVAKKGSQ